LVKTQQNHQLYPESSTKLLSLVAASLVGSTWRREHPAQTVKVFFDPMKVILLHQFDGSFSQSLIETQRNHQFFAKGSTKLLSLVAASLSGSTQMRECSTQTVKDF
jgi:hypothetical protein